MVTRARIVTTLKVKNQKENETETGFKPGYVGIRVAPTPEFRIYNYLGTNYGGIGTTTNILLQKG